MAKKTSTKKSQDPKETESDKKEKVEELEATPKSEEPKPTASETKPEEDIDAFKLDAVPKEGEEAKPTEVEEELIGEEGEKFEEEIQEERFYNIPLAKYGWLKQPKWNRTKKAIKVIRDFLTQHMKPEGEIYISQDLNERVWERGLQRPPRKIRVRVTKSVDGIVRAYLA